MGTRKKDTTHSERKKKVDLPPKGPRNTDPLSGAAGAHPIETGTGALVAGATAGLAGGAIGGPVGAVIGAVGGAVIGGLAGKGVGELIDPTTEDTWREEYFNSHQHKKGRTHEDYRAAYRYGVAECTRRPDRRFEDVEADLRAGWDRARGDSKMSWDEARGAAKDAFDRTLQLREERLQVDKTPVKTGEVKVRKEVHTDRQTVTVPVEREEVVIERRPGDGRATGDVRAEEIRIPTREEKVRVSKETVDKGTVHVSKRKVQDTEQVSEELRREELKVETKGDAKVRDRRDQA